MTSRDDKTEQLPATPTPRPRSDSSHGRFKPGEMVAGRYRIVSRLGSGGMGEVYRADDIKLEQPVALKFLPPELSHDPDYLARLHGEVRVGRTVSHPNVCRLYDIAEADGQHFIAMEYVAGEDLATLLKRIGRLPHDKAVAVATQLASGLAAAHGKGILHRDLKPANVMLDTEGDVRITDFGLAAEMSADAERGVLVGTPAYMAPEQLAGKPASVASDIYGLGLVLFETFTGKRAIRGRTLHEIVEEHRAGDISSPSSIVRDIDPAVESLIVRCLDKDPAHRPRSARDVLAALPGGDPLAAAVAAGQTPSPELVAAAGVEGSIRPSRAALLTLSIVGLLFWLMSMMRASEMTFKTEWKNPEVVRDTTRSLLQSYRIGAPGAILSDTLLTDHEGLAKMRRDRPSAWWKEADARSHAMNFWVAALPPDAARDSRLPTFRISDREFLPPRGTAVFRYNSAGQLNELRYSPSMAVPPAGEVDWSTLFKAAGLAPEAAVPVTPSMTPLAISEQRHAWRFMTRGAPLLVEAARIGGTPTWFRTVRTWEQGPPVEVRPGFGGPTFMIVAMIAILTLIALALVLAWLNMRRGRGDVAGAVRLSSVMFGLTLISFLLRGDHSADLRNEVSLVLDGLSDSLLTVATLALLYLGVEPALRRRWPQRLVSWSRLLAGHWRDPLVGRDVLIGLLGGVTHAAVAYSGNVGEAEGAPVTGIVTLYTRARYAFGAVPVALNFSLLQALALIMALGAIMIVIKKPIAAVAVLYTLTTGLMFLALGADLGALAGGMIVAAILVGVLTTAGPLGVTVMQTVFALAFHHQIVPTGEWFGAQALIGIGVVALLLLWGLSTSVNWNALLRFKLLED